MGANASTTENVVIEEVSKIVENTINNTVENTSSMSNKSYQKAKIVLGNVTVGKDGVLNVSKQKSSLNAKMVLENNTEFNNKLTAKLTSELGKILKSDTEQKNEGINLGQANISNTRQVSDSRLKTVIGTAVTNSIKNTNEELNELTQIADIEGGDLIVDGIANISDQSIEMKILSTNISDSIVKNLKKDVVTDESKTTLESSTILTNEGVTMGALILIVAIVALVVLYKGNSIVTDPMQNKVAIGIILGLIAIGLYIYFSNSEE